MNHIVITGATGVIGRRTVRTLLAAGHPVTGITRSARGRHLLAGLCAHGVEADVFDEASLAAAFAVDNVRFTPVPEPSSMVLLSFGLIVVSYLGWLRCWFGLK